MQQVPAEYPEQHHQSITGLSNDSNRHHGPCLRPCLCPVGRSGRCEAEPCPVLGDAVDGQQRRLSALLHFRNALTPSAGVVRRSGGATLLSDFPNEILTHILSHLHPDSHAAVALVSKRFYALVTSPHAWRMAFLRYFAGHTLVDADTDTRVGAASGIVRLDTRYFSRLTALSGWRSEYLLRTRLIRGLTRGRPASRSRGIGSSGRAASKNSAVLTYNSKLLWPVTSIHAILSNGQKPPRVIHGAAPVGAATISDPTTGKVEKWGLEDPFVAGQLHAATSLHGLGEAPTAVPNVMDVSQSYGVLLGEGFPGGRAYFRGASGMCGRYLDAGFADADSLVGVPRIPQAIEAICSVWIAKSSVTPVTTQSMCGMLTGSTLGVVTAYSLGWDPTGPRRSDGDMTARWVVSPGVPITALKVDDGYSPGRKSASRMWAVALNALGEVYFLTEMPGSNARLSSGESALQRAWLAGRSAQWHLIEATRRVKRQDEPAHDAVRSSDVLDGEQQLVTEALEMGTLMRRGPAYFRRQYEGWDMQRRLEVDFAADDENGAGEGVFVLDCGLAVDRPVCVSRWTRSVVIRDAAPFPTGRSSPCLFAEPASDNISASRPPARSHGWRCSLLDLKSHEQAVISASGMDCSSYSLLTSAEDPLHTAKETSRAASSAKDAAEIPGRRARFLAVGTGDGSIVVWNARQLHGARIQPVRIIQTESPQITSLAVSALYLVHGGSDGLVQAWDHLASTTDAIRTIHARSSGRAHRQAVGTDPALREGSHAAAGAMYLDPDPTVLRGVVSLGALLRFWSYTSASQTAGRKRRSRHSDVHGRLASRRLGGAVSGYIAAEEAEVRREKEHRAREQARLRKRFGSLGDLTEEEALRYAQMVSQEAFLEDERRRASDSAADAGLDTASSLGETTADTVTPPPSVAGASPRSQAATSDTESESEQHMQQALRLSLLEAEDGPGQGSSPGGFEYPIIYRAQDNRRGKRRGSSRVPLWDYEAEDEDEALARALSLSLQDQAAVAASSSAPSSPLQRGDFPPLHSGGGEVRRR